MRTIPLRNLAFLLLLALFSGCQHLEPGIGKAVDFDQLPGWEQDHAMVPHGIAVIVNSPAVFEFTGPACPDRHMAAARSFGNEIKNVDEKEAGSLLAQRIMDMMKATGIPNGLTGVGFTEDDLENLTDGAIPQQRLIDNAPLAINRKQLKNLFKKALTYW